MNIHKKFTVVVCTYKREKLLKRCLIKILNNNFKPSKIVIIDQNIDKKSLNLSRQIFKKYKFNQFNIVKNVKKIGLTKSKNISLNYIKTKYVVFLDDDILINKNFFENLINLIFKKKAHGVCGVITNFKKNKIKNFFYYLTNYGAYKDNRYYFQNYKDYLQKKIYYKKIKSLPGGITCFDTNIFNKIKFDEKYITHNYEDVDFSIRLKKLIMNYKFYISLNSFCIDGLKKKQKENISLRFKFMYLLFLKNKSIYFLLIFLLSFLGLIISNLKNINFILVKEFYSILINQKLK
tara:strand:- start:1089 stop:1964 length:876 start_codon:yes stop_codon:yes gene_type:complete